MKRNALIILIVFLSLFTKMALSQSELIEKQIVVMFKSKAIEFINNKIESSFNELIISESLKNILTSYNTIGVKKGWPEFESRDTLKILSDGRRVTFPDYTNYFVITLKSADDADKVINQLKKLSEVETVEKNAMTISESNPNDPFFGNQWGLKNTGQGGGTPNADINIVPVWNITNGNVAVKIGIVDELVQTSHEDFIGRVTTGGGTFSSPHGMHVTGIAAATGHNNTGIAGINWVSPVYNAQIGTTNQTVAAVNQAIAEGCQIINCSWAIATDGSLYSAMWNGYKNGVLFVSAGMQSSSASEAPKAFGPWILNVAAMQNDGSRSPFGRDRYYHDVSAPGGFGSNDIKDIFSALYGNSYGYMSGTSMAAPHVTGIASLMLSVNSNLRNYEIEEIIRRTSKNYPIFDEGIGYGIVDALKAVQRVMHPNTISRGAATLTRIHKNVLRTFNNRPKPGIESSRFVADVYELSATANFTPHQNPGMILMPGYSPSNPNYSKQYLYENATSQSVTAKTYFYYLKVNDAGQNINTWVPYNPNDLPLEYTLILGSEIALPSISSITQSPSPLYRGQSGTITCNASGDNLTYSWTVQSQPDFITLGSLNGPSLAVSNNATYNKSSKDNLYFGPPQDLIVTCTVSNPAGSVFRSFTANVIPGNPPGGGCPFLFVQSDNGYIMDNNLLHRSEFEGNAGKDIKDVYKLKVNPVADKNKLKFQIKELNHDHSYFDRIKLYSVDHHSGTEIGVTENNDIVLYLPGGVVSTSNAVLNDKNITNLIQYNLKSPGVEGVSNERIFMNFDTKKLTSGKLLQTYNTDGSTDSVAMIMNVEGIGVDPIDPPKEMAGTIDGNESAEKRFKRGFARREKQSVVIVPLGNNASLDSLNIDWHRNYDMQYAAVTPVLYGGYDKKELNFIEAVHSIHGNIKQLLNKIDQSYAELDTNGFITLTFNSGGKVKSGWVRSYIIEVDGYYVRPGVQGKNGLEGISIQKESLSSNSLPVKYELGANYPNPFNPTTTIDYAVPSEGQVTVKVYDILGREVVALVNEYQSPGRYKVTWNAAGMPSGLHIYRMTSKEFNATRKMLLIK